MQEMRQPEDRKSGIPDYEIVNHIAIIKEDKDKRHRTELNRIKWNGMPSCA